MKVSIVTVSFNQSAFLREAMDSVIDQHYDDLEYIVVDPGSTDGSREIITQYRHKIAHTLFDPDDGAADGLNKGFSRATGEIYGFLNSDDFLLPGALQKVASCFRSNPATDIVMGDGFITNCKGEPLRHVTATSFTPRRLVYGGTTSLQQATFFRSRLYVDSGGFNSDNKTSWDIELFLDMVQRGARITYLRSDLACFRLHGASITGTNKVAEAYRLDQRRLFTKVQDRARRRSDILLTVYFKSMRFLADPFELVNTIKARLTSGPVA